MATDPDTPQPLKRRDTFFNGSNDPALQPAHEATSSQRKFWKSIRKDLKKDDIKRVDAVVQSYENDHTIAGLESLLAEYLPAAEDEKNKLYDRREKGGKQVSTHVQKFAKTFADFLGCYSQVLELVKTADNQFGGVAVQTLSLLLVVAVNKSGKEELIENSLLKIKHNFPRLRGLRNIYPTPKMQELVAQVYEDVLVFAQRAIEYYKRSAWARVWKAISEPPQLSVQIAVDKILDELAEVKDETNFLLNGRVHKLEHDVEQVKTMLEDQKHVLEDQHEEDQQRISNMQKELRSVQSGVGQIKRNHSEELLSTLQEGLLPDQFLCTEQLEDYRGQLQARFGRKASTKFGLAQIMNQDAYQRWQQSKTFQTLVLRGRTRVSNTALSWLSQAAVELVDKLKHDFAQDKTTAVIYHFCKREGMTEDDHMHTTLSRLVYQLLQARPSVLDERSTYASYTSQLESASWQKRQLKTACKLLVDAMSAFETVYVVIDRPETCKGGKGGLAKILEALQQAEGVLVKVFVVADGDEADDADLNDWRDAAGEGAFEVLDGLDQR